MTYWRRSVTLLGALLVGIAGCGAATRPARAPPLQGYGADALTLVKRISGCVNAEAFPSLRSDLPGVASVADCHRHRRDLTLGGSHQRTTSKSDHRRPSDLLVNRNRLDPNHGRRQLRPSPARHRDQSRRRPHRHSKTTPQPNPHTPRPNHPAGKTSSTLGSSGITSSNLNATKGVARKNPLWLPSASRGGEESGSLTAMAVWKVTI